MPEKSFAWAHNLHVMYAKITDATDGSSSGTFGERLRTMFKDRVYSIGLEFNEGSFVANEIRKDTIIKKTWVVDAAPRNTFPYFLSTTNMNVVFMNFSTLQNESLAGWLSRNPIRGHGRSILSGASISPLLLVPEF